MRRRTFAYFGRLVFASVVLLLAVGAPARGTDVTGSSGTDTSIPPTDSAITASGRGRFSDLKVTVNQTKNLLNQAISITWKGGAPTVPGAAVFASNYLQMMQCWGDDDGTNVENPGPPPEQCAQGATEAVYGGRGTGLFPSGSFSATRIISYNDGNTKWQNYDPAVGTRDSNSGYVYRDFRAVKGEVVGVPVDANFNPTLEGGSFWNNSYFNVVTTNEIAGARTLSNGTGSELFEVHTGKQDSGLGCGQSIQPVVGGGTRIPKCWLVIVPRGTPADENVGTPSAGDAADRAGVVTSPVAPEPWKNRIAIPLEFNPVDSPCALSDDQRRVEGSALAGPAIASWQPALCGTPGRAPYVYAATGEASARQQLVGGKSGAPGMIVVSRPISQSVLDTDSPVVYAPLTLSGVVIGFNVERRTDPGADADAKKLIGVRVASMHLTPRLLAKLLTQSYAQLINIKTNLPYEWLKDNPASLGQDKDFLQFNPEFKELVNGGKNFAGPVMPVGGSDAARQVWEYVLADPEARAWLDGTPDPFGMRVNPVFQTKGVGDAPPVFGDPVPESFPKNEPFCYQAPAFGQGGSLTPPPLCGTDWVPFVSSFRDAAREARAADDGAKVDENPFANSSDKYYSRALPQALGSRSFLAITDSASAYQYGLQTAALSRAGDDGSDRKFVAPSADAMAAGVAGMAPKDELSVLEPDPAMKVADAYPLTVLTYAATKPLALDAKARSDYADFVAYAADAGQFPGFKFGQLPNGYAPLPATLKTQAVNAAKTIRDLQPAPEVADAPASTPTNGSDSGQPPIGSFAFSGAPLTFAPLDAATMTNPLVTVTPGKSGAKRVLTPAVAVPGTRFALPGLAFLALLATLGALEITKRPRKVV